MLPSLLYGDSCRVGARSGAAAGCCEVSQLLLLPLSGLDSGFDAGLGLGAGRDAPMLRST